MMPFFYGVGLSVGMNKWNEEQIMDAMHANMHEQMVFFAGSHPRMQLICEPDVTAVQAELKDDMVNYVLAARFTDDNAHERVKAISTLYQERQLPFSWWLSEGRDTPHNLADVLLANGLKKKEIDAGMYLRLDAPDSKPIKESVRRVEDREQLRAFVDVIISVGGHPQLFEMIYQGISLSQILDRAPMELYLIEIEGNVATTGMLFFHADVAGI
ncbi:MAG: hypothetical protein K0U10_06645, partial [Gammaproteobacteria bacterium]|nr:hypothetical protein [Gammaproteobacteria bacterium]